MADDAQSADDALEPKDDIFNPKTDAPRLARDYDPPAAPADDTTSTPLPPDHPLSDSSIDAQELYDEGLTGATDADAQEEEPDESPQPFEFK
jgi:hypothetical protein